MWDTHDIDDLDAFPAEGREVDGYAINIRPTLMADDLLPFVVTPKNPARRWGDDPPVIDIPLAEPDPERPGKLDFSKFAKTRPVYQTVFLCFPDLDTARASSLGQFWKD